MLMEYANVSQKEADKGVKRRWFGDEYFDLIVWYDLESNLIGFQLCYDKYANPHALTWRKEYEARHERVDEGGVYHSMMTPILVADGYFPGDAVYDKFARSSGTIEKGIRELVLEKIQEYHGNQ